MSQIGITISQSTLPGETGSRKMIGQGWPGPHLGGTAELSLAWKMDW